MFYLPCDKAQSCEMKVKQDLQLSTTALPVGDALRETGSVRQHWLSQSVPVGPTTN